MAQYGLVRAAWGFSSPREFIQSGDAMIQSVAIVFPLPVMLALVVLLLVLLVLSAVALSLHGPAPVRFPPGEEGGRPGVDDADGLPAAQS